MKDISKTVQKITDAVTILGPAIVAVVGVVSATGAHWANAVVEVSMIALGAASSIASLVYNAVTKE